MTYFQDIYDAFMAKILEDEWADQSVWSDEEINEDMHSILMGALPWFKFPRVSLEIEDGCDFFEADLSNEEIQILATYMKCEWLNRTILTWENIKPLYEERDFSQANLLAKFNDTLNAEKKNAQKLEALYYRSRSRKPFDYTKLASQL